MSLRKYLLDVADSKTIEELWDAHLVKMAEYGFDRLLYGFTRYRTSMSLGDPADCIILTNHNPEYTKFFLDEGHYFHAPMVHWALENEGAKSWGLLADMERTQTLSAPERRVLQFNRDMGVTAGYSISFKSVSARSKGAIALTARADLDQAAIDEVWKIHCADIILMNNIVHLKILTLPYITTERALTLRQREVLEWVGDGKTTQDIALLMGVTVATVEKHLRLAREALAVETTAQAILKAAFSNQMFVLDI